MWWGKGWGDGSVNVTGVAFAESATARVAQPQPELPWWTLKWVVPLHKVDVNWLFSLPMWSGYPSVVMQIHTNHNKNSLNDRSALCDMHVILHARYSYIVSSLNNIAKSVSMTTNVGFDKGKTLLDRVIVWWIWWEINEFDTADTLAVSIMMKIIKIITLLEVLLRGASGWVTLPIMSGMR